MAVTPLTAERLRELLVYDPETGVFTWRKSRGGMFAGSIAGANRSNGYVCIEIDARPYSAHRLAWLYVHGVWPPSLLDHRDTNKRNNAIGNLRLATKQLNAANSKLQRNNTSGFKGVVWHGQKGCWTARIKVHGRQIHLGVFEDIQAAHEAYAAAAVKHFGEFARVA